jgi:hypothetical protein
MEEQVYVFLAGGILGIVIVFVILLLLGAHGADPDNW